MPRCNFRWTNLPEAVLRGLCRDLDLGGGDPAKTLRSAFAVGHGVRRSVLGRLMPPSRQSGRHCATVGWLTIGKPAN